VLEEHILSVMGHTLNKRRDFSKGVQLYYSCGYSSKGNLVLRQG
jgi:hypothetical protein